MIDGAERHAAIEQNRLHQTLQQAAEKYLRPFPQGLKPIENQALNVGAKAPTPLKMGIFSTALNCCSTALAAMDRSQGKKLVPAGFTPHRGQPENAPKG